MLKFNRIIAKYLVYALPLVIAAAIWCNITTQEAAFGMGKIVHGLWSFLGLHFVVWFFVLLYFVFALVFSGSLKELMLSKLACIKERDEREEHIVGRASRHTFLSVLALSILLLFLNIFDFNVSKLKPDEISSIGNKNSMSLSLGFTVVDIEAKNKLMDDGTYLQVRDLPLSKEGIILLLILWQIGSYMYFARREVRRP